MSYFAVYGRWERETIKEHIMALEVTKNLEILTYWEIFKTLIPLANILVITIFGFIINKKFAEYKSKLSTENIGNEIWANKFITISHEYSDTVTSFVTGLGNMVRMGEGSAYTSEDVGKDILKISKLEWDIQNYTRLSGKYNKIIEDDTKELYSLLLSLIKNKKGDLEYIRKKQFSFNDNIKKAHLEILNKIK